ncbi:MAG: glycoside hydrolase family 97 catalytic domain-containing protein, partial [Planctomycetes bacterium]|nr:glycoside hydrolase family 97 catalytic domain-containing protein [Planctomycetota bacterium]
MLSLGQLCLLLTFACAAQGTDHQQRIVSPNRAIPMEFLLRRGVPYYTVSFKGESLIKPSRLGFRFAKAPPMTGDFRVAATETRSLDETWRPVWGTAAEIRNHCNELTVTLRESTELEREMGLVFRAYDDGVALRYILPEQPNLRQCEIVSEETRFNFAGDFAAWWIPANYDSYEMLYSNTPLSGVKAANTPITMKTGNGLYLSIHEAALTDYSGMTLKALEGEPASFECDLVPWPDGVKVRTSTPCRTPWRTIQISPDAAGLIESHLILNLNEPCKIEDTSWIKPMKYVGIWWGMHVRKYTWYEGPRHGATTENAKRHIDFAAAHGIPGLLVEGWNKGWRTWGAEVPLMDFCTAYPDFDLGEVVRYGKEKGVSLIGHHETSGNVPDYERQMEDAFVLYEQLGVPAVKTGYAGTILPKGHYHHGQYMVNHYRRVVETAAKHRITIDAHEPIKPTGIERTWPNMMTREGGRGMEYNAWSEGNTPEHTVILPFTRLLAGPMDYTPG